jgi:hypothetical protein
MSVGNFVQELNKCKTEFQYWRSKSPATPLVCGSCGGVIQPQPSFEELRGLLGADFIPIAGPSHECEPEQQEGEAVEELEVAVEAPPRAKRKRDGGSRDSMEGGRKSTRGKGRKKAKI